jgi:hypothetical protein
MFPVKDTSNNNIKYVGRSKATVVDNRDPLNRGRIRVSHSVVDINTWIPYLRHNNSFDVPPVNSIVYIEADSGFYTHPVAHGGLVAGNDNSPIVPSTFRRDNPTNRGLYTPNGHLVELDDGFAKSSTPLGDNSTTPVQRGIRITSIAGNKIWIQEDSTSSNQNITISDVGGNQITLDYSTGTPFITIEGNGNLIVSFQKNAQISAGTKIQMQSPLITLNGDVSGITTFNSHMGVIDLITGVPVTPSTTVFSDV